MPSDMKAWARDAIAVAIAGGGLGDDPDSELALELIERIEAVTSQSERLTQDMLDEHDLRVLSSAVQAARRLLGRATILSAAVVELSPDYNSVLQARCERVAKSALHVTAIWKVRQP